MDGRLEEKKSWEYGTIDVAAVKSWKPGGTADTTITGEMYGAGRASKWKQISTKSHCQMA